MELYTLVNKVRGDSPDENDENGTGEIVICLITGATLRSGSPRRGFSRLVSFVSFLTFVDRMSVSSFTAQIANIG